MRVPYRVPKQSAFDLVYSMLTFDGEPTNQYRSINQLKLD